MEHGNDIWTYGHKKRKIVPSKESLDLEICSEDYVRILEYPNHDPAYNLDQLWVIDSLSGIGQ